MKTITFKYTKKDGSTSERTMLALVSPGDKFAGIDVSSLDIKSQAEFFACAKDLHEEYLQQMKALQEHFDVVHNYRQFFADKMEQITEI